MDGRQVPKRAYLSCRMNALAAGIGLALNVAMVVAAMCPRESKPDPSC